MKVVSVGMTASGTAYSLPLLRPRCFRAGLPPWESHGQEVEAVLDAAGSEAAVIFGVADGAAAGMSFAATQQERASGLILFNALGKAHRLVAGSGGVLVDTTGDGIFARFGSPEEP